MESKTGNKKIDHHCGNCCWFFGECTDGDGCCAKHYWDKPEEGQDPMLTRCDRRACKDYISRQSLRTVLYVLLSTRRFLRAKMIKWRRLWITDYIPLADKAIDISYQYIKTFSKL